MSMKYIKIAIGILAIDAVLGATAAEERKPSDLPKEILNFVERRTAYTRVDRKSRT